MKNNCLDCQHYFFDEEYIDHHLLASWCECAARDKVSNLKQFPFKNTKCADFKEKS